ncbi:MAG TPA: PadR family transcriptional regulator [Actinomycetota bacterium]
MNSTRLFVLGSLAKGGPMHGHQIRRQAQVDRTELWTDIKPGSLYGALHRMEAEGVIEAVRTEREGNLPARTVYAITEEGIHELYAHRDEALRDTRLAPDPVDLALQYTQALAEEELLAAVQARRQALDSQLTSWLQLQEVARPYLTGLEPITFDHTLTRLRAELEWHDWLLEELPKLLAAERQEPSRKERR